MGRDDADGGLLEDVARDPPGEDVAPGEVFVVIDIGVEQTDVVFSEPPGELGRPDDRPGTPVGGQPDCAAEEGDGFGGASGPPGPAPSAAAVAAEVEDPRVLKKEVALFGVPGLEPGQVDLWAVCLLYTSPSPRDS